MGRPPARRPSLYAIGAFMVDGLWFRLALATLLAVSAIAIAGAMDITSVPPSAPPSTGGLNGGGPPPDSQAPTTGEPELHTVVAGDTLIALAGRYYGDESLWPSILEANADRVGDPNNLQIGTTLVIPER